jgi:hypothetical protein
MPAQRQDDVSCQDCGHANDGSLLMVSAELGDGAFLAVLCETCWHRRQYRAELQRRAIARRLASIDAKLKARGSSLEQFVSE